MYIHKATIRSIIKKQTNTISQAIRLEPVNKLWRKALAFLLLCGSTFPCLHFFVLFFNKQTYKREKKRYPSTVICLWLEPTQNSLSASPLHSFTAQIRLQKKKRAALFFPKKWISQPSPPFCCSQCLYFLFGRFLDQSDARPARKKVMPWGCCPIRWELTYICPFTKRKRARYLSAQKSLFLLLWTIFASPWHGKAWHRHGKEDRASCM